MLGRWYTAGYEGMDAEDYRYWCRQRDDPVDSDEEDPVSMRRRREMHSSYKRPRCDDNVIDEEDIFGDDATAVGTRSLVANVFGVAELPLLFGHTIAEVGRGQYFVFGGVDKRRKAVLNNAFLLTQKKHGSNPLRWRGVDVAPVSNRALVNARRQPSIVSSRFGHCMVSCAKPQHINGVDAAVLLMGGAVAGTGMISDAAMALRCHCSVVESNWLGLICLGTHKGESGDGEVGPCVEWLPVKGISMPEARYFATLVAVPGRDGKEFVMYGGTCGQNKPVHPSEALVNLVFDPDERVLFASYIKTLGVTPEPRFAHMATTKTADALLLDDLDLDADDSSLPKKTAGGDMFIFGGVGEHSRCLNSFHKLDLHASVWSEIFLSCTPRPTPRAAGSMIHAAGSIFILGGVSHTGHPVEDCWGFWDEANAWDQLSLPLLRGLRWMDVIPWRENRVPLSPTSQHLSPTPNVFALKSVTDRCDSFATLHGSLCPVVAEAGDNLLLLGGDASDSVASCTLLRVAPATLKLMICLSLHREGIVDEVCQAGEKGVKRAASPSSFSDSTISEGEHFSQIAAAEAYLAVMQSTARAS